MESKPTITNTLLYFNGQLENDTVAFTDLLAVFTQDILKALHMSAICHGLDNSYGIDGDREYFS